MVLLVRRIVLACELKTRGRSLAADVSWLDQLVSVARDVTGAKRPKQAISRKRAEGVEMANEGPLLANIDPITGLADRRLVMSEVDRAILKARHTRGTASLIMFGIDQFEAVGNRHGHMAGDIVLRKIADFARVRARAQDLVARVGCEEFLWLMPGSDAREAAAAAERLRWTIEAGTLFAPFPAVTISVGHATLEPGEVSLSLFARADAAFYEAKRSGRNRVRLAA